MASNSDTDNVKAGCLYLAAQIQALRVEIDASPGGELTLEQVAQLDNRLEDYVAQLEHMATSPLAVPLVPNETNPINPEA